MTKNLIQTSLWATLLTLAIISFFAFRESSSSSSPPLDSMPLGAIIIWAGPTPPSNDWEICTGQTKLKATNADLYEAIGGYWNKDVGSNADFFQLPDLRGVFIRGVSGLRNDKYKDEGARTSVTGNNQFNETVGSFQIDKFEKHNHGGGNHNHTTPVANIGPSFEHHQSNSRQSKIKNSATPSTFSGNIIKKQGGSETRPKNAYIHYIIKVK